MEDLAVKDLAVKDLVDKGLDPTSTRTMDLEATQPTMEEKGVKLSMDLEQVDLEVKDLAVKVLDPTSTRITMVEALQTTMEENDALNSKRKIHAMIKIVNKIK